MRPLRHDISRKKLNKLLGKSIQYKATFMRMHVRGGKEVALLSDITYDGKLVADHVWVEAAYTLTKLEPKTGIKFIAIAYTYTDKQDRRKNGLSRCRNYHVTSEGAEQAKEDDYQRFLRCNR